MLKRLRLVRIYKTDRDGAIKIRGATNGFAVKTYMDFEFERVGDIISEWRNIKRITMRW